jgi:hypothetical protein
LYRFSQSLTGTVFIAADVMPMANKKGNNEGAIVRNGAQSERQ